MILNLVPMGMGGKKLAGVQGRMVRTAVSPGPGGHASSFYTSHGGTPVYERLPAQRVFGPAFMPGTRRSRGARLKPGLFPAQEIGGEVPRR